MRRRDLIAFLGATFATWPPDLEDLDVVNDPACIQDVVERDQVFRAARQWGERLPHD